MASLSWWHAFKMVFDLPPLGIQIWGWGKRKTMHQRGIEQRNPSLVMIAQWDSSLFVLPVAGFNSQPQQSIPRDFSHSANPSWASVAENGSISPQWHHTTCGQRGGRLKSTDRWWLIEKKPRAKPNALFTDPWPFSKWKECGWECVS